MASSSGHTHLSLSRALARVALESVAMGMLRFCSISRSGLVWLAQAAVIVAATALAVLLDEEEVEPVVSTSTRVQRSAMSLETVQSTGTMESVTLSTPLGYSSRVSTTKTRNAPRG